MIFCSWQPLAPIFYIFFFNDTATTEIYTLSLHDRSSDLTEAPPTMSMSPRGRRLTVVAAIALRSEEHTSELHHTVISYAVFCLKKKKKSKELHNNHTIENTDKFEIKNKLM